MVNTTQTTLSSDNEYLQIKSNSDSKAVASVTYNTGDNKSGGFLWDMTNAKVVVIKMNGATAPYIGISSDVLNGNQTSNILIKAEPNPKPASNSADKFFVYVLPNSLTKYSGIQRLKVFKIYANHQISGDVACVDWIKAFPSVEDADNYINSAAAQAN